MRVILSADVPVHASHMFMRNKTEEFISPFHRARVRKDFHYAVEHPIAGGMN